MASAHDFFDPAIRDAQFAGERVASLTEAEVLGAGGKKLAQFAIELDAEAQLKNLERMVREESLGKIFGDGEIFKGIVDIKKVDVSFYEMKDGTGMQIAKIDGGENAILALLSKADMDDLDLMPKYRAPKAAPAAPQIAKLEVGGQQLEVTLAQPEEKPKHRAPIDPMRAGGAMRVNIGGRMSGGNPLAAKAFLTRALTQSSMAMPSRHVGDMAYAMIATVSPEAHPEDEAWPAGVKVVDVATGETVAGPAQAQKRLERAIEGVEGPVIERDDLAAQMRKARGPK